LRLRSRVALDGLESALARLRVEATGAQETRPSQHRVEWVSKLVRERREEFVFGVIHALGLAIEARVVDGHAGAPRELLDERHVRVAIAPARFGVGEGQRAE